MKRTEGKRTEGDRGQRAEGRRQRAEGRRQKMHHKPPGCNPAACPTSNTPPISTAVFCLLSSVFCPLSSVFCPLPSVFCPLPSVLCLLPSALCPLPSALCLLPSVLCSLFSRCHFFSCFTNFTDLMTTSFLGTFSKSPAVSVSTSLILSITSLPSITLPKTQ